MFNNKFVFIEDLVGISGSTRRRISAFVVTILGISRDELRVVIVDNVLFQFICLIFKVEYLKRMQQFISVNTLDINFHNTRKLFVDASISFENIEMDDMIKFHSTY